MALFPATLNDPNYPKAPHFRQKPELYKTAEQIELVLAHRRPSDYPTLRWNGIRISPRIRVLPSITFTQILDLETSQLHVDRLRRCQLKWTVSVINW